MFDMERIVSIDSFHHGERLAQGPALTSSAEPASGPTSPTFFADWIPVVATGAGDRGRAASPELLGSTEQQFF
jgi:hypothetical protein